mgnify:CR=1 FL=1
MSETINIPRDTTMQLLVKVHRDQIAGEMDLKYKEKVAAATSKAEVDFLLNGGRFSTIRIFTRSLKCWRDGSEMFWLIQEFTEQPHQDIPRARP